MKVILLAVFLPTYLYLATCGFMSMHYRAELDRYDDAGLDISGGWTHGVNVDDYHVCLSRRYLAAGDAAITHSPFDLWWMIRNWNRDFLAEQPPCTAPAADLHFTTLGDSTGTGPSEDYVLSEFGVSSIELRVSVEMDAQRVWRDKLRIWEKPSPCYPGWHDISSREEIVLVCWSKWNEIMHEATPTKPQPHHNPRRNI